MDVPILSKLENVTSNTLLNKRRNSSMGECCFHCEISFTIGEDKILFNHGQYHKKCFVCAQCLEELDVDMVYQDNGRMYCLHDFKMLIASSCFKCDTFILQGNVIKALDHCWHATCFVCFLCSLPLYKSLTFKKFDNKPFCPECYIKIKSKFAGTYICHQCKGFIEAKCYLKKEGEYYHPYHFKCQTCLKELDIHFTERNNDYFCIKCFDKMGIPICTACKQPVEERVIYALGKVYHVEHFVCSFCNKPFLGTKYFLHNKEVFCESHHPMMLLTLCSYCNKDAGHNFVEFLQRHYCLDHFRCFACDKNLNKNSSIFKVDRKPICKACLLKFPAHLRKRLAILHKADA